MPNATDPQSGVRPYVGIGGHVPVTLVGTAGPLLTAVTTGVHADVGITAGNEAVELSLGAQGGFSFFTHLIGGARASLDFRVSNKVLFGPFAQYAYYSYPLVASPEEGKKGSGTGFAGGGLQLQTLENGARFVLGLGLVRSTDDYLGGLFVVPVTFGGRF